jgi:drug/metabolite transporter (DMT)-like permease
MSTLSDNVRGAIFMMLSMAGFVLNDTAMRYLSSDMPMFQAIFLRGVFATVLIGMLAWRQNALWYPLSWPNRRVVGLRVVGEIGATICFITALFNMPIANATAILQAMPLAVTLAASLFLGEAVGWRRYSALLIGFSGVLLIVRPGSDGFTIYSVYAMISILFLVLRDLTTRKLSIGVPSMFVALISSVAITLMGGILSLTTAWAPVSMVQMTLLAMAAVFVIVGYLFGIMTMRVGEVGFISPFRYTILIWAIVTGIVVFGDIPDAMTLLGSLIVVLTGLYTFYRERLLAANGRQTALAAGVKS